MWLALLVLAVVAGRAVLRGDWAPMILLATGLWIVGDYRTSR